MRRFWEELDRDARRLFQPDGRQVSRVSTRIRRTNTTAIRCSARLSYLADLIAEPAEVLATGECRRNSSYDGCADTPS